MLSLPHGAEQWFNQGREDKKMSVSGSGNRAYHIIVSFPGSEADACYDVNVYRSFGKGPGKIFWKMR